MENPGDVAFILTHLSVCPRALMIGIANDILVGNSTNFEGNGTI
jgi:hypothetical protein